MRWRLHAWEPLLALGVAIAMLAALFAVADTRWLLRLEELTLDLRFRLRTAPRPTAPVVIIGIDNQSIAELGRWPWSRTMLARLLDRLTAAGAKVVVFDLLLSEPQRSALAGELGAVDATMAPLRERLGPADKAVLDSALARLGEITDPDASLAAAIGRAPGVIVPFVIDLGASQASGPAGPLPAALAKAEYRRARGEGRDHLPRARGIELPVAPLLQTALLGHVTTVPDPGGTYHFDYPVLRYGDAYLPSESLEAARVFLGLKATDVVVDIGTGIDLGSLHVPTDEGLRLIVNYYPQSAFQHVSFAQALDGRIAAQTFTGKIVLVGATATGLGDVYPSPYAAALPGVERHATLIANILGADFIRRDGYVAALDAAAILVGALAIGFVARRGTLAGALVAGIFVFAIAAGSQLAFDRYGLWLNVTLPLATIALTFLLILAGKYFIEWRRERWIRNAFGRYLHPDYVDELCRSPVALRLGGDERELTVLFADVRDFSAVAERLSASELVATMNEFFTAMTDVVLAHRGMLDKYIGDSLMAVFGAPLSDPDHALNACLAAIGMRSALHSLHAKWRAQGRPCLDMRVGINTGLVVIGNMGTERRFDYTVMGDEVNVASRLEGANKELGTDVLISGATAKAAEGRVVAAPRGLIAVKGRLQKVEAFELIAASDAVPPAASSAVPGARTADPGERVLRDA